MESSMRRQQVQIFSTILLALFGFIFISSTGCNKEEKIVGYDDSCEYILSDTSRIIDPSEMFLDQSVWDKNTGGWIPDASTDILLDFRTLNAIDRDKSGLGISMEKIGNPDWIVDSETGWGHYHFNEIDQHIQVNLKQPLANANAFTLEAWVRLYQDNFTSNNFLLYLESKSLSSVQAYHFTYKVGFGKSEKLQYYTDVRSRLCQEGKETRLYPYTCTFRIRDETIEQINGEWAYVAYTFDGMNVKTYLNGKLLSSCKREGLLVLPNNAIIIGNGPIYKRSNDNIFHGDVRQIRIIGKVLTDSAISEYYEDFTKFQNNLKESNSDFYYQ